MGMLHRDLESTHCLITVITHTENPVDLNKSTCFLKCNSVVSAPEIDINSLCAGYPQFILNRNSYAVFNGTRRKCRSFGIIVRL